MLDNTARQLAPQPTPTTPTAPVQTPQHIPEAKPQATSFSPFEKLLVCACGILATVMCLFYLGGQNQLANSNRTYQDVQAKIATQNQNVTDLKQTIGELSNSNRLNNFAKAHGLTVIEGNIKRVNK
ncbi:cell division protein FtsL [Lacticaseibacillus sp. GG6-2]